MEDYYYKENTKRNSVTYKRAKSTRSGMKSWNQDRKRASRTEWRSYIKQDLYERQSLPDSKSGGKRDIWVSPESTYGWFLKKTDVYPTKFNDRMIYYNVNPRKGLVPYDRCLRGHRHGKQFPNILNDSWLPKEIRETITLKLKYTL